MATAVLALCSSLVYKIFSSDLESIVLLVLPHSGAYYIHMPSDIISGLNTPV